jgi:16S rRNA pseudouridine516 synthase
MRLDQRVATFSHYSRSEVKKLIRAGAVLVDGVMERNAARQVEYTEQITLEGQVLAGEAETYLMLHKPVGVVSAHKDDEHATVLSLIDLPNKQTLTIAGRLDKDTTGLLLLSTDGTWAHRIMSPKHQKAKVYRVDVFSEITELQLQQLRDGVLLHGEPEKTRPATAVQLANKQLRLTIYEGKYHQVKRMLAAVGNKVVKLHREQVGGIMLDESLALGEWRYLTNEEVQILS